MSLYSDSEAPKRPVSENGLFWITLILLSIGTITTFCYQGRTAQATVSPHNYQYSPDSSDSISYKIITLYDADKEKTLTVTIR